MLTQALRPHLIGNSMDGWQPRKYLGLARFLTAQLRALKDGRYFDEAETLEALNHRAFVIRPDVGEDRRAAFF